MEEERLRGLVQLALRRDLISECLHIHPVMNTNPIPRGNSSTISPVRHSTTAESLDELVKEQLLHYGLDPDTEFGQSVADVAKYIYGCHGSVNELWTFTQKAMSELKYEDKAALFNSKKFLSFQLAKVLDTLQNPFRHSYQSLEMDQQTITAKGPYPVFDNVAALFSATPAITRTSTYIYACAEWIADAFEGKELLLEIYSRLLNPTSISLANHIVDLEAGRYAQQYFAWNFNSGMAAIDATLSHLLGYQDVIIRSKNIYGGAHQLIHDWYAKSSNLDVAVETFPGETAESFLECWDKTKAKHADRLNKNGGKYKGAFLYLESPCNPHGYVLDVPAICQAAHKEGLRVVLDATVGTPFLQKTLMRDDPEERPDFLIHSYTKDLSGMGTVTAGVVIGKNEDMFIPKGMPGWEQTLFWNVYYVKGAFLSADGAFEVIQGAKTLNSRMLSKCINTVIMAKFLDSHPDINVNCSALPSSPNYELNNQLMFIGLPAALFTIEMGDIPPQAFKQFFDSLEPVFSHMITLGQTNTIVSCPALTTHSELSVEQLKDAGIFPTTIRFSMGIEDPNDLIKHFRRTAGLTIDPVLPGFSDKFTDEEKTKELIASTYTEVHNKYINTVTYA